MKRNLIHKYRIISDKKSSQNVKGKPFQFNPSNLRSIVITNVELDKLYERVFY